MQVYEPRQFTGYAVLIVYGVLCGCSADSDQHAPYASHADSNVAGSPMVAAPSVASSMRSFDAGQPLSPAMTAPVGKPAVLDADVAAVDAAARSPAPSQPQVDAGTSASQSRECSVLETRPSAQAAQVDVVWVIDSSGSMRNERETIQLGLNAFAHAFAAAQIDMHVVVITERRDFDVPGPLGTDPQRFRLIDRRVGSHEALETFLDAFDDYASFLRPSANLELIAVTDDESRLAADRFVDEFSALVAKPFRLHAIASERIGDDACEGAKNPGDAYYAAATLTAGLKLSICRDVSPALFDALSAKLSAGLAEGCTFELPSPPAGFDFDPDLVDVRGTEVDASVAERIPRVGDATRCGVLGWYYADRAAPKRLTLCPRTCADFAAAVLRIALECHVATAL